MTPILDPSRRTRPVTRLARLAAAAVLALPHLIEEPVLRARLLQMAQAATGYPLEIEGGVRLELTPLPQLSVDRVTVRDPGRGWLRADRADVDLALAPLLRGQLAPSRVHLVRPHLELEIVG